MDNSKIFLLFVDCDLQDFPAHCSHAYSWLNNIRTRQLLCASYNIFRNVLLYHYYASSKLTVALGTAFVDILL